MYTMVDAAFSMYYSDSDQAEFAFGRRRKNKGRRRAMGAAAGILGAGALAGGGFALRQRMKANSGRYRGQGTGSKGSNVGSAPSRSGGAPAPYRKANPRMNTPQASPRNRGLALPPGRVRALSAGR